MRETEIEIEETKVERVYCDECGGECTDDHEIEPREVCPSCAEGRSTYQTATRMFDEMASFGDDADDEPPLLAYVVLASIHPFVLFMLVISSDVTRENRLFALSFTAGAVFWTLVAIVLLV